jgi:CubicO group peptidase (beta-lactamase class C family)
MRLLFILLATCFAAVGSAQPAFIKDSLDQYVNRGMQVWKVPGLAIVIVKDGKPVVMKGYGVRSLDKKEPVDEQTLFFIASNSKLFTGTALAHLEYLGKLSLNDPIRKFYPDYSLYNDTVSQMVTIRDLLLHRIGTKTFQGDFTFWNSKLSREEIMKRMRLLKPSRVFRQDYGYCNSCYLTAGQVIPVVTGRSWEEFVRDSITMPAGMTSTYISSNGIQERQSNMARPYTTSFTNTLQEVPFDKWDNLGPAASIVSNVSDLAKWLQLQLDSGRVNGKRVLPFQTIQKTRDLGIITSSRKSSFLPTHFVGYGLGLSAADYNGRQVYWHTGGAAGMVSNVCFVPEENLGIAILTNNDNQSLFELLRYQVLDAYLGVPYRDRSAQILPGFNKEMESQVKEIAGWKERVGKTAPALPLDSYVGNYDNELYGMIRISKKDKQLLVSFSSHADLTATLDPLDKDEWLLQYNNIEYGVFITKFKLNGNKVASVDIKANDFVEYDAYTFEKK